MKLNQLKIGQRLGLAFGGIVLLMLLTALVTGTRLVDLRQSEARLKTLQEQSQLVNAWRSDIELNLQLSLALIKSGGVTDLQDFIDPRIQQATQRNAQRLQALEQGLDDDQAKASLAKVAELRKGLAATLEEVFLAMVEDPVATQRMVQEKMLPQSEEYLAHVAAVAQRIDALAADSAASQVVSIDRLILLLAGISILAALLSAVAAWRITRSVTVPLSATTAAADRMTAGDMSVPIPVEGRDEVASLQQALARMQQMLATVVGEVRSGTESMATASAQIATGNQDLSTRTEQTAGNLQQAASSLEELTGTVGQTADSARTANQLAASASTAAQRGGEVVSQVVSTMNDIQAASRRIADIIGTIDGIAFQTNILALNAAVEAARAGEQGRGFAVVAGEVRTLAQRSAEAAREIKTLIGASVDKVETGTRLVGEAGGAMAEIVSGVQRVTDVIGEISAATTEQSGGLRLVNEAVAQLDQMTQQNAALVEESAAAAQSMAEQSRRLTQTVVRFKVSAVSATPAPGPRTAPPARTLQPAQPVPVKAAAAVTAAVPAAEKPAIPSPGRLAGEVLGRARTAAKAPAAASVAPAPAVTATPESTRVAARQTQDDDWETF
jgi:methyl-accepting chemotaxis protein